MSLPFSPSQLAAIHRTFTVALSEDIGRGDITSIPLIAEESVSTAKFLVKSAGVIAGTPLITYLTHLHDPSLSIEWNVKEGETVPAMTVVGTLSGSTLSILSLERTALNFLQRMCGIATRVAQYSAIVHSHNPKCNVLDTRKTVPGLRLFDKYAVARGGGTNHRIGLFDQVLVKDNHITAVGGIAQAVASINKAYAECEKPPFVVVEVRTLQEVKEVLECEGVNRVLLDNMVRVYEDRVDTSMLERAVKMIAGRLVTEASGGVTVESLTAVGKSGVDFVSIGELTHSVKALDISLKIQ